MKEKPPLSKVVIYFFSGTGNARQVALWFAAFAAENNISCRVSDISKENVIPEEISDPGTLVMIISPTHGFNYPKITLNFILTLPRGRNRVVLMNTRAGVRLGKTVIPGLSGVTFFFAAAVLSVKRYRIAGTVPFDMPSNWLSIHPSLGPESVAFLHEKIHDRVKYHAMKIFSNRNDFHALRDLMQDILISPVSLAYFFIGRYVFAKSFYAGIDCDNCGICIRNCPVQAVKSVDNRPFWTLRCESCMKCMNNCPRNAIETAHALLIITSLLSSLLFSFLAGNVTSRFIRTEPYSSVIGSIVFLLLLVGLYKIQHMLIQRKTVGRLISFLSLTHHKFWGRYKSIPDSKWRHD